MPDPEISIITVTFNSQSTISDTINSILNQSYPNIEYIIVDGGSTDGTVDIIKSYGSRISKFISESDKGIYDAINKGIQISTGDIIGILNSDDFFYDDNVIQKIADAFDDPDLDAVYGDVIFVDKNNLSKITRYYSSENFKPDRFRFGFMPAHPGFFCRKELFEKFGYYKVDYKIGADFELLLRFMLINKIMCKYLDIITTVMRTGGASNRSFRSNLALNNEILRACRENGVTTNYLFIYSKYFLKIFEFLGKSKINRE
jgi:glycosyltransferase involved in cell wall biosynthesis